MALSQKEIEKIVKKRAYFQYGLDVNTGEVVSKDGKRVVEVNGEMQEYKDGPDMPDSEILYLAYNEDTERRIRDFLPRVLNQRGITDPSDIDISHPHVQAKIREVRRMPGRNKRSMSEDEQIAIIEMVRKSHKPQYLAALMQTILWAMVYDDMFTIIPVGKSGNKLETKFDFEIPDNYWEIGIKASEKDELLYQLVTDAWKIDFKEYDKNNPLEMMLAYATTLLEVYPEVSENISILQAIVVTAFTFSGGGAQFDDATFLNAELDDVLRKPVVRKSNTDKRDNTRGRVSEAIEEIPTQ